MLAKKRLSQLLFVATVLLLSGCQTLLGPNAPPLPSMTWPQRQQQLQAITAWQAQGVVGIRQPQHSDSASFNWQQADATHFELRLFGPFGAGAVQVHGEPGRVSLVSSSKPQPIVATSPEELIKNQTGWDFPVGYLYYWIRGIPVAGLGQSVTLDAQNRLSMLTQDGWQIQYMEYTQVGTVSLPSKMALTRGELSVKMVIKEWGVGSFTKPT